MKETGVINIVEDEDPLSILFVAQPVTNKLKDVGFRILPTCDLHAVSNLPIALLEASCVTRVDPKNPGIW
jgi:hypothetical protein